MKTFHLGIIALLFSSPSVAAIGSGESQAFVIDNTPFGVGYSAIFTISPIVGVDTPESESCFLSRPTPNPFNPSVSLRYRVNRSSDIRIDVFDISGRHVRSLLQGRVHSLTGTVDWNGCDDRGRQMASGAYFVKLESEGAMATQRVLLVK